MLVLRAADDGRALALVLTEPSERFEVEVPIGDEPELSAGLQRLCGGADEILSEGCCVGPAYVERWVHHDEVVQRRAGIFRRVRPLRVPIVKAGQRFCDTGQGAMLGFQQRHVFHMRTVLEDFARQESLPCAEVSAASLDVFRNTVCQ